MAKLPQGVSIEKLMERTAALQCARHFEPMGPSDSVWLGFEFP